MKLKTIKLIGIVSGCFGFSGTSLRLAAFIANVSPGATDSGTARSAPHSVNSF